LTTDSFGVNTGSTDTYEGQIMDRPRCVATPRIACRPILTAFLLSLLASPVFSEELEKFPIGDVQTVEAVVHAPAFNGACWLLITKYGPLEPTNLEPEYRKDGLKIVVSFRKRSDLASTCMMGRIVTLLSTSRGTTN
jgi:hypothetical protein